MTVMVQTPASRPGASFTKATVRLCCAVMHPVISTWNKTTGLGFEA
jgi:hypothetical protein